jgi:hypothetical protein
MLQRVHQGDQIKGTILKRKTLCTSLRSIQAALPRNAQRACVGIHAAYLTVLAQMVRHVRRAAADI